MKPDAIGQEPANAAELHPDILANLDKWIDAVLTTSAPRSKRTAALIACICTLEDLEPADQQAVAETLTAFYVFNRKLPAAPAPTQTEAIEV